MPILPVFLLELTSPTVVRIVLVCSTHSIWKVLCKQCTDENQMDPISFLVTKHVGVSKKRGGFPPKSSIKKSGFPLFSTIHFGGPPVFLETPMLFVCFFDPGSNSTRFFQLFYPTQAVGLLTSTTTQRQLPG